MRLRDALNCIARLNFGGGMDADWKMRHGRLLAQIRIAMRAGKS
jgi:hypothetical protein